MRLPIGYDNFGKIIESGLDFVDKSLFIKDVLDDKTSQVIVITRPRRFGKTLNLSMLHHFLAAEVYGVKTKNLFDRLKIAQSDSSYMKLQGSFPVIFITLKDIKDGGFKLAYDKLHELIIKTFRHHSYLADSPKIDSSKRKIPNHHPNRFHAIFLTHKKLRFES